MKIEVGKYYDNKTWRFLMPVLRGHGEVFASKFNSIFKFAVGIHDTLLDGSSLSEGRNILILIDKKYRPKNYQSFMDWIKYQPYFKGDYCPDPNFETSRKHMLILEIPKDFNNAYDMFLKSNYSDMYDEEQMEILFNAKDSTQERKRDYQILKKSPEAYKKFLEKNEEAFNTILNKNIFNPENYEFPLVLKEEIFNYKEEGKVFFEEKINKTWNT